MKFGRSWYEWKTSVRKTGWDIPTALRQLFWSATEYAFDDNGIWFRI